MKLGYQRKQNKLVILLMKEISTVRKYCSGSIMWVDPSKIFLALPPRCSVAKDTK